MADIEIECCYDDVEKLVDILKYFDIYIDTVDDFVYHDVFGNGKVLEVSKTLITIAFKHPYGVRKLMKNHKALKKIWQKVTIYDMIISFKGGKVYEWI